MNWSRAPSTSPLVQKVILEIPSLEIPKTYPFSKQNIILSKIIFFLCAAIECYLEFVPLVAHTNTQILNATTEYILTTKRFNESLFHS